MEELIQKVLEGRGLTLTWLGMGTVFFCLMTLYLFFLGGGVIAKRRAGVTGSTQEEPAGYDDGESLVDESEGVPGEVSAAIAMALDATLAGRSVEFSFAPASDTQAVGSWRLAGRVAQHSRSKYWER